MGSAFPLLTKTTDCLKNLRSTYNSAGEKIGDGIWTKSGDNFLSTYHNDTPYNATYSLKAVYNTSERTLTGTFSYGNNDSDGGTFKLSKK